MLMYEVNIAVNNKIIQEYKIWLDKHVAEMLKIDGFCSAEIINNSEDKNITHLTVKYQIESQEKLDDYFKYKAKLMRQESLDKYGDYVHITRKIFNITP